MELITYLLKVSVCTVLFFAIYLLVLRRLTFFRTNRFYLLFTLLLSFAIPILNFTIEREVIATEVMYDQTTALNDETPFTQFQTSNQVTSTPIVDENFDWYSILPYLYFGIVACLLVIATWRILQLVKHARNGTERVNGLKIVSKTKGFTNCSFFHYVFIDNENLSEAELQVLLKHEQVHAKQLHSIDKVLLIIVKAFLWFNPVVYLYDKALEQAHEYEADEATSQSFGAEQYANLLLRLAIAKSEMSLVHNFVKSPIKERIKMLFNAKSKDMKKLLYLLALPVVLGLLWGFTVKVVDVSSSKNKDTFSLMHDAKHGVKDNDEVVNQSEKTIALTMSKPVLKKDSLIGKTLKGKVVSFSKSNKIDVLNLQVVDKLIPIWCNDFKDKIKIEVGDDITVILTGSVRVMPPPPGGSKSKYFKEKPSYFASKVITATNSWIYKTPIHPFLYEANKARYASSKIKSIAKNSDGTIKTIVLNDKVFTINLNVAGQKFKSQNFKVGDLVSVKFIGEKFVGRNTYNTDKMIVLYSQPKKYELKNKTLFDKFYYEDGKQKIKGENVVSANSKKSTENWNPTLLSATRLRVDNKTEISYIENGLMEIAGNKLEAEEIAWDMRRESLTAKNFKLKQKDGSQIADKYMIYDLKNNSYVTNKTPGNKIHVNSDAYELLGSLKANNDSLKMTKMMGGMLVISGKVKLNVDGYALTGKVMQVQNDSNLIIAHVATFIDKSGSKISGDVIEFDLISKNYKITKPVGTAYTNY